MNTEYEHHLSHTTPGSLFSWLLRTALLLHQLELQLFQLCPSSMCQLWRLGVRTLGLPLETVSQDIKTTESDFLTVLLARNLNEEASRTGSSPTISPEGSAPASLPGSKASAGKWHSSLRPALLLLLFVPCLSL